MPQKNIFYFYYNLFLFYEKRLKIQRVGHYSDHCYSINILSCDLGRSAGRSSDALEFQGSNRQVWKQKTVNWIVIYAKSSTLFYS